MISPKFTSKESPLRLRRQTGHVTVKGTKRKYFYGEFNVYVKDATGKSVRKHRGEFLGYKSETTKSAAEDKLQQIIFRETGQGISATDKVSLAWFWENRFKPMRSGRWSQASQDNFECDWRNELKDAGAVLGHANYKTTTANVYAQSVHEDVRNMVEQDEREMGLAEIEALFERTFEHEERKLRLMHADGMGGLQ